MRCFYCYSIKLYLRVLITARFEEVQAISNLNRYVNFVFSVLLLSLSFYFR